MTFPRKSAALALLLAICSLTPALHANSLFSYNVVTTGDLNMNGGHVHGTALVGGNLNLSGVAEFGADTSGNGTKLSVVGNITGSGPISFPGSGGTGVYGGTAPSGIFQQSAQGSHGSVSLGTLGTEITNDSTFLAGLTANSSYANGLFSATTTNISGLGQAAVFNVNASDLFAQNRNLSLSVSGVPTSIIINVTGDVISTQGGQNLNNFSNYASNIIWNFENASSLTLANSIAWYGSILAPTASVTETGSAINGGVYAKSLSIQNYAEVHSLNDLYTGCITPPTGGGSQPPVAPLPASVWTGGLLLIGLGALQLKRSARTA